MCGYECRTYAAGVRDGLRGSITGGEAPLGCWNVDDVEFHGRSLGPNHKVAVDLRLRTGEEGGGQGSQGGEVRLRGHVAHAALDEVGRTLLRACALHLGLSMHILETQLLDEALLPHGTHTRTYIHTYSHTR